MTNLILKLKEAIKDVPDFPKPGIVFKDLTPLLADPTISNELADALLERAKSFRPQALAMLESRGFWFGTQLAARLGVPCIPIRKAGKLPRERLSESYKLEYGEATLEMHTHQIINSQRVLIHDDLLATGGTAAAAQRLVERAGGTVCGFLFIVELSFLNGRAALAQGTAISSIIEY